MTRLGSTRPARARRADGPVAAPGPDPTAFRAAAARFATGVALVTAHDGEAPLGLVVNSFASVSLRPALISFCAARTSLTWRRMRATGRIAVNVLTDEHADFVARAAPAGADRFAGIDVEAGPGGVPILRDAAAVFACTIEAEHPAGDHWIVIGRVEVIRAEEARAPLVFCDSTLGGFAAGASGSRRPAGRA